MTMTIMNGLIRVANKSSNAITIDATTTAAAGLGKPIKCEPRMSGLVTLKRARRSAVQSRKRNAAIHPSRPKGFSTQEYARKAGAMPKVIISANESYCIPKALVVFVIRAMRPSNPSKIIPITMAQAA